MIRRIGIKRERKIAKLPTPELLKILGDFRSKEELCREVMEHLRMRGIDHFIQALLTIYWGLFPEEISVIIGQDVQNNLHELCSQRLISSKEVDGRMLYLSNEAYLLMRLLCEGSLHRDNIELPRHILKELLKKLKKQKENKRRRK